MKPGRYLIYKNDDRLHKIGSFIIKNGHILAEDDPTGQLSFIKSGELTYPISSAIKKLSSSGYYTVYHQDDKNETSHQDLIPEIDTSENLDGIIRVNGRPLELRGCHIVDPLYGPLSDLEAEDILDQVHRGELDVELVDGFEAPESDIPPSEPNGAHLESPLAEGLDKEESPVRKLHPRAHRKREMRNHFDKYGREYGIDGGFLSRLTSLLSSKQYGQN